MDINELPELDKYILVLLNEVNEKAMKAYKEYRFADITNMLSNLMTNELSAYYMDYTKDILYIEKKDAPRRRQVQTVLWHAVNTLVRLWAPILVHTCEEVNDFFHTEAESIHLGSFAQALDVQGADPFNLFLRCQKNILLFHTAPLLKSLPWHLLFLGEMAVSKEHPEAV